METIKNGNSRQWYVDGVLFNPLHHGISTTWFPSGNKRSEGKYEFGLKTGEWKYWSKEGKEIKDVAEKAQD